MKCDPSLENAGYGLPSKHHLTGMWYPTVRSVIETKVVVLRERY